MSNPTEAELRKKCHEWVDQLIAQALPEAEETLGEIHEHYLEIYETLERGPLPPIRHVKATVVNQKTREPFQIEPEE